MLRRNLWPAVLSAVAGAAAVLATAHPLEAGEDRADHSATKADAEPAHPIDPALDLARRTLAYLQREVHDYTAVVVKREEVNGKVGEEQTMLVKIRNRKLEDGKLTVPFAVYMRFLKPASIKGREVIWVEDENDGKMLAHEAGLLNLKTVALDPNGFLAMLGQRYPITKIGVENLGAELIVKGEALRKYNECEVTFYRNAKIDRRSCTMIQVMHPTERPHFEFYKAQIFIDDELNVPIRYVAWRWPETPGGELPVIEEYTYRNMKVNVGLTDKDFDPENPDYDFP